MIADDDSIEEHIYDTISGSDWLGDQDAIEAFVNEAPRELLQLEHWGCPWSRQDDGRIAVRAFGGMKNMRTWFAADKTGFHMLHALFQTSLKYREVKRYDECFVTRLLVDDGRVHGVVAVELVTGQIQAITAKAVVLATGGCGKVFPFTTNANINTGDGMALAYRAGAPLKDMEFVQYHPTGLPFTGILITEATRAEGGWLLNKDGYRFLQDYDLGTPTDTPTLRSMELGPRDRVSQALRARDREGPDHRVAVRAGRAPRPAPPRREADRGPAPVRARAVPEVRAHRPGHRADPGPAGRALHDGRGPHRHRRQGRPGRPVRRRRDRLRQHQRRQPARLELAARVPGVRGARGPGRRRVRRHRARAVRRRSRPRSPTRYVASRRCMDRDSRPDDGVARIRDELQSTMEDAAGIYRTGPSMEKGVDTFAALRERVDAVGIRDTSRSFNTELVAALELANLVDVAEMHAALRDRARGVPGRAPAHRLPRARRREVPGPPPGPA